MLPIPIIEPHCFDLSMVRVEFHVHGAQNRRKPILHYFAFHIFLGVNVIFTRAMCRSCAMKTRVLCNRNVSQCEAGSARKLARHA